MTRWLVAFALFACSSPSGTLDVTTGGEADALTRDPAVASIQLDAVDSTGAHQTLATATVGGGSTIDLGNPSSTVVASLQLTGTDAAGDAVLFGATPLVELGALSGSTIPLFVQRKGELARMPGTTEDGRASPFLAVTGRAVYYAGGTISGTPGPLNLGGYDLLSQQAFTVTCELLSEPRSFALVQLTQQTSDGDYAYAALVDDGGMTYVGLPGCNNARITTPPQGLVAWSDVAGGRTVMGDDGTAYIVGATKTDAKSSSILVLKPDGTVSTLSSSSRRGAAATWAPGRGVFLYGGSGANDAAEIITASGADTSYLPADPTTNLGATAFDASSTMLVAGDSATRSVTAQKAWPRKVDLTCTGSGCATTRFGPAPLPVDLTTKAAPSLFRLGDGVFLIVGDDPSGSTRVFRLDGASPPTEIHLKIPRQGARAVQTSTGAVVIVGGGSSTPESYVD